MHSIHLQLLVGEHHRACMVHGHCHLLVLTFPVAVREVDLVLEWPSVVLATLASHLVCK